MLSLSRADSDSQVENEGIRRALLRAEVADLVIVVIDGSHLCPSDLCDEDKLKIIVNEHLLKLQVLSCNKSVIVINKLDLVDYHERWQNASLLVEADTNEHAFNKIHLMSCQTSLGLDSFLKSITNDLEMLCQTLGGEGPLLTRERHTTHLRTATKLLNSFLTEETADMAIRCHYLRLAIREIARISSHVGAEQILDSVFADFCIGK